MDIVTASKVTDNGIGKPVLSSATGRAQRVLHVDNTAALGGDGSKEHPFNTLKAAEAAMRDHDVIYVHRGNGTTAGQDQGIVIDKAGVSLIGSGVDFVYDNERFVAASGKDYTGVMLAEKPSADHYEYVECGSVYKHRRER